MGLVDATGRVNFYDGQIRVVGPDGEASGKYAPQDYRDYIAERVEPWTYLKFPYLKKVGWKGFVDGKDSGVYEATPLSRLNAADGMATPLAQEEYERFYETLAPAGAGRAASAGPPPAGHALGPARRAALRRRAVGRAGHRPGDHVRQGPHRPDRDADRGRRLRRGAARHAHPPLLDRRARHPDEGQPGRRHDEQLRPDRMSVKKAARSLIHGGEVVSEGLLNRVEMAFRAYDPCFGCATHSLPGQMPLEVVIRDAAGGLVDVRRQFC